MGRAPFPDWKRREDIAGARVDGDGIAVDAQLGPALLQRGKQQLKVVRFIVVAQIG
ncbi:MAG: hypothetical protein M3081_00650 [Gemmatimonadota bacterium]|nr:hypothetical protein [Gemmatimonadota bacterium]